jgi:hypothetical protein
MVHVLAFLGFRKAQRDTAEVRWSQGHGAVPGKRYNSTGLAPRQGKRDWRISCDAADAFSRRARSLTQEKGEDGNQDKPPPAKLEK